MKTPIALIAFKRPEKTREVLDIIRQIRPSQFFLIVNAPRSDSPDEVERSKSVKAILEQIDWPCEVTRKYSETYFEVGEQISNGLSWLFEQVEEAIIVEDDCILHPSFFPFCEELLDEYRNDHRICSISAQNVNLGRKYMDSSYYFSRYTLLWGWATWRRAWQHYDYTMKTWPAIVETDWLRDFLGNERAARHWKKLFQATYKSEIKTWDYQWTLSCWLQGSLSIHPNVNLVRNVGFDASASNPHDVTNKTVVAPLQLMEFPLKHPSFVRRCLEADEWIENEYFEGGWKRQMKESLLHALRKFPLVT